MPMDDQPLGTLRIKSEGNIRVSEVRKLLESLENAYNGTAGFLKIMDAGKQWPIVAPSVMWNWAALPETSRRRSKPWFVPGSISALVPPDERLILRRVHLTSPGFWELLGIAAVLGVIREYLKDRDERRKDKDYREAFERDRLRLENEIRKNEVISGRLKIARELGFKEDDSSLILDRLVVQPLGKLGAAQDRGLIAGVDEEDIDDEKA